MLPPGVKAKIRLHFIERALFAFIAKGNESSSGSYYRANQEFAPPKPTQGTGNRQK